jgi:recombination associated protein RdgC
MFKNATIYQIAPTWQVTSVQVEQALAAHSFCACASIQEKSVGWVPPRGEDHGALLESIGGQWIMRLMIETRSVPADALKRDLDERLKQIYASTGRKPGKKEQREIQSDARIALLPHAFSKQTAVWVWIDPKTQILMLDTASTACAHVVVTELIKAFDGLVISAIHSSVNPESWMADMLVNDLDCEFSAGRIAELQACDESKAKVKFTNHTLDSRIVMEEISQHFREGKIPVALQLIWADRVQFMLSRGLVLKQIKLQDVVFEATDSEESAFDADVAIATAELKKMFSDLFALLDVQVAEAAP